MPLTDLAAQMAHLSLPPLDERASPATGLTRVHWETIADDLLLSVARFATPAGARLMLPGRPSASGSDSDGVEGFARTFLLAAMRTSTGGDPHGHLPRYLEGLLAGTDAAGPEAWAPIGDLGRNGQLQVEAASVALSLHLTRAHTWDQLSTAEQDRVATWLQGGLDKQPAPNNWHLFPLTVASFLEAVGRADDQTAHVIARGLALLEHWHRGEGWYSDGAGRAYDHYNGWALHTYPVLHAWLRGDAALLERLGERLHTFLGTYAHMFDANGAPMHMGRSLTYRFGALASIGLGELVAATPLTHGQSRRMLSAGLAYFLQRGARTDGILTLGWHGEHPATLQRYSGPGSPYWASTGFLALLLPAEHPLWTSTEQPAAPEAAAIPIASTGLLIQSSADGLVRLHNHGSDNQPPAGSAPGLPDPLYSRHAYSTRTGPTARHNASDNDLQVRVRGIWSARRRIFPAGTGTSTRGTAWAASWFVPEFPQPAPLEASDAVAGGPQLPAAWIDLVTLVHGGLEVRVARLHGIPPGSPIRLSGYAIAGSRPEDLSADAPGPLTAAVTDAGGLTSQVRGLLGWDEARPLPAPQGTAFGRWALVPELTGRSADGALPATLLVAAAQLQAEPAVPALEQVTVEATWNAISIDWADGAADRLNLGCLSWPEHPPGR